MRFEPAKVTAAILAGGAGLRLDGRDKGLESLAGQPLIAHVVCALRAQTGALLICANRNMDRYAQFAPVVRDAAPGFSGPLAGISAALTACQTDWLLTAPVDCPSPPADLARRLRMASARAAVVHAERGEPLFALYHRDLAAAAATALARNEPVWRWQRQIGAIAVDFADARESFANLNTMDEFRRWERTHGR